MFKVRGDARLLYFLPKFWGDLFPFYIWRYIFQAANLLKRTEGLVSLVVSNPGKKDSSQLPLNGQAILGKHPEANRNTPGAGLKPAGPPSRPSTPIPGKYTHYYLSYHPLSLITHKSINTWHWLLFITKTPNIDNPYRTITISNSAWKLLQPRLLTIN